ncbi:CoA-transferase [Streptomyces violascens]|uniref:CoA-transferase n=1 Tax=Streptomyces violascens TaxID=67381 RepID=UPI00365D3F0D
MSVSQRRSEQTGSSLGKTADDVDALVARHVRPGDHLHLAGTPSRPNALTYALCRVFGPRGRFTISTTAVHGSAHALTLAGAVERVIAGFIGDTCPTPRPNPLYRDLATGEPFTYEAWSLLSYAQRLMAGAMGLPYAVTASLAGTDLEQGKGDDLCRVPDPNRPGEQLTLLTPLTPDVTLVHGTVADEDGNVVIMPPLGEGAWAAYAARRGVIASVERIVSREELRQYADRVVIPGRRVIGVCEAPMGAHPQSLRTNGTADVAGYLDDYAFLEDIVERCRGEEKGLDWYREWVTDVGSHDGYLARLGAHRREALRWPTAPSGSGKPGSAPLAAPSGVRADRAAAALPATATRQERLIILGARAVADRVREDGYDTLLSGIGASHLATWLASELLERGGHDVTVVAELGMYGLTPEAGDVYLFSLRHADRAQQLSGIPEILGGMVAANPRALGVLAAAEIDASGVINTSRLPDGRWLTGSGGANDIASTTDCVVIATASPRRFVPEVAYRTSPGERVREVVSQFGRFVRDGEGPGFRLHRFLPEDDAAGTDDPTTLEEEARLAVAQHTSWKSPVAGVVSEKPITKQELELLRSLDPQGYYR